MAEPVTRLDPRRSDAALVTAALEGDERAKEALFRRYVGMVSGLSFRLLGRDEELEDIVQESFAQAFGALHKLERPQAFAAWLSSIVTRVTIATIRRRRLLSRLGLLRGEPVHLETIIASTAPPDVVAELTAVYGLIAKLPVKERVVLILRRVEELSLEEVATQTGWSLATVKRALVRAEGLLEVSRARGEEEGG
ncbi:RNA polymerase sigma factor [Polyangium sorediatum]|uniref:RNA polymerase sigma factor n=1 Tax=Polyangium sorediatum TaxID=889274 RepID=A0ABT6PA03_9BACT|nr:RNA polymerase sigma factor [Polyangium sorediatum]MDI1437437.1 RNA polymerase sigma factor [Polyangium sorediatum]